LSDSALIKVGYEVRNGVKNFRPGGSLGRAVHHAPNLACKQNARSAVFRVMDPELSEARDHALGCIDAADTVAALEAQRPEFLGRKSTVRQFLKRLGELPPEQRPEAGRIVNEVEN